jgi:hypothetical protein
MSPSVDFTPEAARKWTIYCQVLLRSSKRLIRAEARFIHFAFNSVELSCWASEWIGRQANGGPQLLTHPDVNLDYVAD